MNHDDNPAGAWIPVGRRDDDLATMIRACQRHRRMLLFIDPWLPFPQRSCSFAFGERAVPLPIGVLFRLWERGPEFTGECHECGGRIHAYTFGGLLATGGAYGVCVRCGAVHANRLGGFPRMAMIAGPHLDGTWFQISRMSFGGCFPGARKPLYRALRRLGETDLPNPFWSNGTDRRGVSLRFGDDSVWYDFNCLIDDG
jgi:hypothetical protein